MTALLTAQDTADYLHISVRTLRRLVKAKLITPKHIGRGVFFTDHEVERYVNTNDRRPRPYNGRPWSG